jgi:hypothetical protein
MLKQVIWDRVKESFSQTDEVRKLPIEELSSAVGDGGKNK